MKINPWILVILLISFAGVLLVYPSLPAEIPSHWNMAGEVDDYSSRGVVLLLAAVPVAIYLMMTFLPNIDPKKSSYKLHGKAYEIAKVFICLLLSVSVWISILVAKGASLDVGLIISSLTGVLFMTIGNYMGQIRHNYFFGIRTPWTLANETVWKKTHRVGGYTFIALGAGLILVNLLRDYLPSWILIPVILIGAGTPIVYSYFIFRKITGGNDEK